MQTKNIQYNPSKQMQIPSLVSSLTKEIICFLLTLFILSFIIVKFVALITTSHIFGLIIVFFCLFKLLRLVGIFALYPASFKYIKADYEIRGSQRIGEQIVRSTQDIFTFLKRVQTYPDTAYLVDVGYNEHVKHMRAIFGMFASTLSQKKKEFLHVYDSIHNLLKSEAKIGQQIIITYEQFIANPAEVRNRVYQAYGSLVELSKFAKSFADSLMPLIHNLNHTLAFFQPPLQNSGLSKMIHYKMYSEKLYQIRFTYIYWQPKYQFNIHEIQTQDSDAVIQCAVISGEKGKPIQHNKCVIISNPNGAYLQYFALQSQYIQMYLSLGYQIVLWNYRGYGQSTGEPSISTCILDAQDVYNYCKRVLKLDPQIAHGYSIGGPPSAVLALTNMMKILVVDRTFCNFVNIAHEISPVLAHLARIVLKADSNVNISDVYLRIINCRKILIWSSVDEVVSNGSSLKLGILNKLLSEAQLRQQIKQNLHNSSSALVTDPELNEREVFIEKDQKGIKRASGEHRRKYKRWLQKTQNFFNAISSIYEIQKSSLYPSGHTEAKQISPNNSLAEQLPTEGEMKQIKQTKQKDSKNSDKRQMLKNVINQFWDIVGNLDGGGTTMKLLKHLTSSGLQKQEQLFLQVKSFVLGLLFFGCCYHQNGNLNVDNLDNWPQTIASLKKVTSSLTVFISKMEQKNLIQLTDIMKQFSSVLNEIKNHIQKTNHNKDRSLGIILPTDSGHNGELQRIQLQYLKAALTLEKQAHHVERLMKQEQVQNRG